MSDNTQERAAGGRFASRKEERPDELSGKGGFQSKTIPMPGTPGSEKFHYRVFSVDKDTNEAGREDHHLGLGYQVVKAQGRQRIAAVPKEEQAARVKAAQDKSVRQAMASDKPKHVNNDRSRTISTTTVGKGGNPLYGD